MHKKGKHPHVLVIRLSAMGDVAMVVPVLKAFIKRNPGVKITVLTKASFKPIFSGLKNVSVYVAEVGGKHEGFFGLFKLFLELRKLKITAVADLHNVLRSNILKRFFQLIFIPVKQIDKGRKEKKALTRISNKIFQPLKSTHERYAEVFVQLGFRIDLKEAEYLNKRALSGNVFQDLEKDGRKWIGIAPFAAHKGKMYPLALMQEVIIALDKTDKYKILLFGGGKAENNLLQILENKFDWNVINLAGKFSLVEELLIMSNLNLMVSMDSGNAHLAANYGIPVITIWGMTHPYAGFYPFGQPLSNAIKVSRDKYPKVPTSVYGNKIPEGYEKAMQSIEPREIFDKIVEVLEQQES